ncbi:YceI family protein [Brevibacterium sp. UCMA 11752]|nr:YceI family protein [Brevibacterium sp. UCMA 11752]
MSAAPRITGHWDIAPDTHLRSADSFDVETYSEIRFASSAIDEVDENS